MSASDGVTGEHHLTAAGYRQLRRATETYRQELLLRLGGEVGLRAAEMARCRAADLTSRPVAGQKRWFLAVREDAGTDDGSADATREAYVPADVAHDLQQYVRSNDRAAEQAVLGISPRRIQMLVGEVGERAAAATGRAVLATVTPSTLRQYFGRRLLVEDGVDPRVVQAVGGWTSLDTLVPDGDAPDAETVVEAFAATTEADGQTRPDRRLAGVVSAVASVGDALAAAGSRDAIEAAVPEQLVAGPYDAAWLYDHDERRDRVTVAAQAGTDGEPTAGSGTGVVHQAMTAGRVLVAPADSTGPRQETLLAVTPVAHDGTNYGALVVRARTRSAFEDPERAALADLGRRIAAAITAIERKQLLLGDAILRLEFSYDESSAVFVALSNELNRTVTLEGTVLGDEGKLVCFVTVDGPGEAALTALQDRDGVADSRLLRSTADGALLEVILDDGSPAQQLSDRGGRVADLHVSDGEARLVAEFAPDVDVRALRDGLAAAYPSVELRRKEETERTGTTGAGLQTTVEDDLTEKQRSVLRAAYHAGYFEWPRGSTAEELADSLGIASPTLHNHLRKAQAKLLAATFDEPTEGATAR